MTQAVAIPETFEWIDLLLEMGETQEANELAATILDTADRPTLDLLNFIGRIIQERPRTCRAYLRDLWKRSGPQARAIIEACAPIDGEQRHVPRPDVEPAPEPDELWTGRATDTTRCDRVRRKIDPEARREPAPEIDPRSAEGKIAATVAAYFKYRAGVDDEPTPTETPVGYHIDYDKAAVPPVRGLACVYCWCERSALDHQRYTDGLCSECRSLDRPGIPPLPAGHFIDEAVAARCAFVAAMFPPDVTRRILAREWDQYPPADRGDLADWVHANLPEHQNPEPHAARELIAA